MQLPVTVLNANTKRDQGKKAQLGNITAAKVLERAGCSSAFRIASAHPGCMQAHHAHCYAIQAVADIIRTTLGPRSMLKMLLDANGGRSRHHAARALAVLQWVLTVPCTHFHRHRAYKRRQRYSA